jgi:hypothetical protein
MAREANNSGDDGGRYWFGFVFSGGPTTKADFKRETSTRLSVTDSMAYTIAAKKGLGLGKQGGMPDL